MLQQEGNIELTFNELNKENLRLFYFKNEVPIFYAIAFSNRKKRVFKKSDICTKAGKV